MQPGALGVNGLLYVNKPAGMTSHDVVAVVRRAARTKRVGHAGTLDPFAPGLLVIAVGTCTRLLPYVVGEPKVYDAVIRFGFETDTDDCTGLATVERAIPSLAAPGLTAALATLTGEITQTPPAFSAKHVGGTRAHALARRGIHVELQPVVVTVHHWDVQAVGYDRLHVRVTCGGGTYVRALARDLGRALNAAAHCESLHRVSSGAAHVHAAVALGQLGRGVIADGTLALRDPLDALGDLAHELLDDERLRDIAHGRAIPATQGGAVAALLHDGQVVAIARRTADDRWQPSVVLLHGDGA